VKHIFWALVFLVVGAVVGAWMVATTQWRTAEVKAPPPVAAVAAPQPPLPLPAPIPAPVVPPVFGPQLEHPAVVAATAPAKPTPRVEETVFGPVEAPPPVDAAEIPIPKPAFDANAWLDDYAQKPLDDSARVFDLKQLADLLKGPLETSSWWKGEWNYDNDGKSVHLTAMLKVYNAHDGAADPFKTNAPAKITRPEDLCFGLSPFITIDGKTENRSTSSCASPGRRHGDLFYMPYVGKQILFFPYPTKYPPPLVYLSGEKWVEVSDFKWRPSSAGEWQRLHDRFIQGH